MRHRLTRPTAVALAALGVACNSGSPTAPPPTASVSTPAPRTRLALEWVERVTGGADADTMLPLVIAMHGLGDRPEAFAELYAGFPTKARIVLLRAPDAWGGGFAWFPFRASDGAEARARGIATATERVVATLDQLEARRPARGKPIVTGFSQGGMLSFAVAARHPERVRAAFPVAGALPEPLWPPLDAGRPAVRIVALHGESDELVPLDPTRAAVEALRARGFEARLESFPGVAHAIPPAVRARYFELLSEELQRP